MSEAIVPIVTSSTAADAIAALNAPYDAAQLGKVPGEGVHERFAARVQELGDQLAWFDHDERCLTWNEADQAVSDMQALLVDQGVRPGDRVTVLAENCVTLACVILACSRLKAWINPLNARMTEAEITRLTDHCRPRVILYTTAVSEAAARHAAAVGAETRSGRFGTVAVLGHRETVPEPVAEAPADRVVALLYTTGTTGLPKGVMLSQRNICFISGVSSALRRYSPQDQVYLVLPMTHVFSFTSVFLAGLVSGATLRFVPRFDAAHVLKTLRRQPVTLFQGVPQMYAQILKQAAAEGVTKLEAPHLRFLYAGGAPLSLDWKQRSEALFGLTLHNGYGMTETSPGIAATRSEAPRDDDSIGPPLPGVAVALIPPPGQSDLIDGVGELVLKGPNVMAGYYKAPELTAASYTADGWFRTGDLARQGPDGALTIVGRCKELIIRSGFNVYPPEVEAAVASHPDVVLAAVVGRGAEAGNEEVIAFAQRAPTPAGAALTEEMLKDFLRPLLTGYKRPSRIVLVDKLPVASTGKLLKKDLLTHFADRL